MTKQLLRHFKVMDDVNIAIPQLSLATETFMTDAIQYEVRWTGIALSGELYVEFSNDGENWLPIQFESDLFIPIAGASGEELIVLDVHVFKYVRLNYQAVAGTGNMTAIVSAKTVGA